MTPFEKKLSSPVKLPSIARDINVLMQALNEKSLSIKQLAEVIKHYPVISARLLYLANSAWSAPINPITSIEQACSRLGGAMVKSISIALSIASSFDPRKCPRFDTNHYWTTAMLVSEGSGLLVSKSQSVGNHEEFEQTAQTAGVLHNLGLLWLAENLPQQTSQALQQADEQQDLSINEALIDYVGSDYCQVGGWLGEQLKFPDTLISAMQNHHNQNYHDSAWELSLLVGSAARMCSAVYNQDNSLEKIENLEALGIDTPSQQTVYQRLNKDFEKTRELVATLF